MSSPADVAADVTFISSWQRQEIEFFYKAASFFRRSLTHLQHCWRHDGVCEGTAISNMTVL